MNLPQGFLICSDLSTFCTRLCSTPPNSDQNGPLWCCSFPAQNTLLHSDTSHSYFIPNTDNNKHGAKGLPSLYPKLPPPFFFPSETTAGMLLAPARLWQHLLSRRQRGLGACDGTPGDAARPSGALGTNSCLAALPAVSPAPSRPRSIPGHPGHRLCWPRRAGTLTGEATLSLRQRAKLRGGFVSG